MKIYIGADHRGYKLKEDLIDWLNGLDIIVEDLGATKLNPDDDYVDFAEAVSEAVAANLKDEATVARGIFICGSGVGGNIVANKEKGIRCGLGINAEQVKAARNADDINILALAADYTKLNEAKDMVKLFLETEFSGKERHKRRIEKIAQNEPA